MIDKNSIPPAPATQPPGPPTGPTSVSAPPVLPAPGLLPGPPLGAPPPPYGVFADFVYYLSLICMCGFTKYTIMLSLSIFLACCFPPLPGYRCTIPTQRMSGGPPGPLAGPGMGPAHHPPFADIGFVARILSTSTNLGSHPAPPGPPGVRHPRITATLTVSGPLQTGAGGMAAPRAITPAPAASSPGSTARGSDAILAMQYQVPFCLRDCHISVCLSQGDSCQ